MGPIDIIRIFRLTHANWTLYFAFLFATGFCYRMIASTPAKRSIIYSFIFLFNTLKSNKLREREREKKTKATTTINESRIMDCMPKFSLAKIKWSQLLRLLLLLLICAWHEFWAEKIHRKLDLVVIGRVVKDRGGERKKGRERAERMNALEKRIFLIIGALVCCLVGVVVDSVACISLQHHIFVTFDGNKKPNASGREWCTSLFCALFDSGYYI